MQKDIHPVVGRFGLVLHTASKTAAAHVPFPIATLHHVYTSRSTFSLVKPVFIQNEKFNFSFRLSIEWLGVNIRAVGRFESVEH